MSWEMQGNVNLDSIDADIASITVTEDTNNAAEQAQLSEMRSAVATILHAAHVEGPVVFVRAGGHAYDSHTAEAGQPLEFFTLTIETAPAAADEDASQGAQSDDSGVHPGPADVEQSADLEAATAAQESAESASDEQGA